MKAIVDRKDLYRSETRVKKNYRGQYQRILLKKLPTQVGVKVLNKFPESI